MKKVLIVDDTKNIRMLLTTYFEVNGYEVLSAKNGQEALDIFNSNDVDIAFLDIKMPEISGTEVLRRIREDGINTPVVIMTAFATIKNAVECTRLGAVEYIQKPFTTEKIKNVLNEFEKSLNEDEKLNNYIKISISLINENKQEEAIDYLRKALAIQPKKGRIYFLLGKAYEKLGDKKEANEFYNISNLLGFNEESEGELK